MPDAPPGVYFGMSEEEYHRDESLSQSALKWLRVSPADFWANSHMNPDKEEVSEESDTVFKMIGAAFHKRIVEGPECFNALYAAQFTEADCPKGTLVTVKDIQARLRELELKVSGDKAEVTMRLLEADPTAKIFDVLKQDYEGDYPEDAIWLQRKTLTRIEIAAAMIEKHPKLKDAFRGGMPEVSIFWVDPQTGVPCKCRLDYIKPRAIVDLKSFGNPNRLPIDRAIMRAIATQRYHIQAAWYDEGAQWLARFIKQGAVTDLCGVDGATINALATHPRKEFMFVFQSSGAAPVARGKVIPKEGALYESAQNEIYYYRRMYAECLEKFGTDRWIDDTDIESIADEDVPPWVAD